MKSNGNITARRYLREVNAALVCPRKQKKQILSALQEEVSDYLAENPQANITQLTEQFGTAEYIAETCLKDLDYPTLKRKLKAKRVIIAITAVFVAACILCLLLWVIAIIHAAVVSDGLGEYKYAPIIS